LTEADVTIQACSVQSSARLLSGDKVQIISGYANNEPIQLAAQGIKVNVLRVADFYPIASDQLIVNESLITGEKDVVTKFTRALQKGMQAVSDDPTAAYTTSLKYIPEAKPSDQAVNTDVLKATIAMWKANTMTLGLIHATQSAKPMNCCVPWRYSNKISMSQPPMMSVSW
jgi:NitT/TauT family transport system substrate-binding protein